MSVGTGRPRTINLEDSNIAPLTTGDFAAPTFHAHLFVAYVSISRQMGDIAESQRRKTLQVGSTKQLLENTLVRWLIELPPCLRIVKKQLNEEGAAIDWVLAPYNFESRQLMVSYFTSLILLHKSSASPADVPTVSLMASSYMVSIFEEFLSRDQLQYLGPVFAFYALAAGLVHIVGFRHESLQSVAAQEFNVIQVALQELGKRWGSAQGALRALNRARKAVQRQPCVQDHPSPLAQSDASFFTDFGPELCSIWHIGFPGKSQETAGLPGNTFRETTGSVPLSHQGRLAPDFEGQLFGPSFAMGSDSDAHVFDFGDANSLNDPFATLEGEGSWLFHDFDLQSMLSNAFHANS